MLWYKSSTFKEAVSSNLEASEGHPNLNPSICANCSSFVGSSRWSDLDVVLSIKQLQFFSCTGASDSLWAFGFLRPICFPSSHQQVSSWAAVMRNTRHSCSSRWMTEEDLLRCFTVVSRARHYLHTASSSASLSSRSPRRDHLLGRRRRRRSRSEVYPSSSTGAVQSAVAVLINSSSTWQRGQRGRRGRRGRRAEGCNLSELVVCFLLLDSLNPESSKYPFPRTPSRFSLPFYITSSLFLTTVK